jgi:hypothetical protein
MVDDHSAALARLQGLVTSLDIAPAESTESQVLGEAIAECRCHPAEPAAADAGPGHFPRLVDAMARA